MWVVIEFNTDCDVADVHGMFPTKERAQAWANKYLPDRGCDSWQIEQISETLERKD